MDILLITIGSHGDVHPFVGIGRALRERGHRVRVATNEYFGEMITGAGLEFCKLGDAALFKSWLSDKLLWHAHKGPGRVLAGVSSTLEAVYDFTTAHATPQTLIVGSSLALGALCAAEKHGFRYATAHLAPICVRSLNRMPTLPGGVNLTRAPEWMKRGFWNGADRWFIDPHIAPGVNQLRAKHGLPPVDHLFGGFWNAPRLTLGLWPDWFSATEPDHPPQLRLTGFPLYDEADQQTLDPDLSAWLAAGDAPIAFTPGSAMTHGHAFFAAAAAACERLGRRGLLLTRHIEQIPAALPPTVRHVSYAPFSRLLPRCAALVHHGGIGTTAQALRAGVPQLIMPLSHDQPDNASHVVKLGVGDWIARRFFWPNRVARKLQHLITDPHVRSACDHVSRRFASDQSIARTVALIEGMAT